MPAFAYFSLVQKTRTLPVLAVLLIIQALINYMLAAYRWHFVNRFKKIDEDGGQLPPHYPALIPYVGNALSFAWNNADFVRGAT